MNFYYTTQPPPVQVQRPIPFPFPLFFVYRVEDVVKVRTGEHGYDALQGEE